MTRRIFRLGIISICLVAFLWLFSRPGLRSLGSLLISDGPPVTADIVVVLAGDGSGNRILKGAEVARQGFAPAVMSDSSELYYDQAESQLAADFAVRHGYPSGLFVIVTWSANSTIQEAGNVIRDLRNRGAHKVDVVTTNWHTARAGRIFRRLAPDLEFHMVGVDDPHWHDGDWWTDREGRKLFFMEEAKTIADFLRL